MLYQTKKIWYRVFRYWPTDDEWSKNWEKDQRWDAKRIYSISLHFSSRRLCNGTFWSEAVWSFDQTYLKRKMIYISSKNMESFEYKIGQKLKKILIKDVIYLESIGKKININTLNDTIEFYGKLSNIKNRTCIQNFLSIHKSYFVNLSHVIEYQ